jgi:cell division septation protein DedD
LSELTHHDTDDGFHEIQLSGKQLVFLFMTGTVVTVLIFLLGVQVGRNTRIENAVVGDAGDTANASPPPAAATPSQAVAAGGPPAAEPPAPATEPDDELSYAKRLQSDSAPTEKLKPPASAPAAATPPPTPPPAASASREATQNGSRPGAWIVQVISLQDRGAAAVIAKRLTGKGYPAFVLDPAPGAPAIYRVQVGGYPDRRDAEQASRRLEKDEQFKPLVRSR